MRVWDFFCNFAAEIIVRAFRAKSEIYAQRSPVETEETAKKNIHMEAARKTSYDVDVNRIGNPIADTNGRSIKGRPIMEFMDELAKRLGRHYGLNDIREAL